MNLWNYWRIKKLFDFNADLMLISGRSKDIDYIDDDPSQLNGVKHTEIVMDSDERVQVKVSKLPKKHDLMQLQWFHEKKQTNKENNQPKNSRNSYCISIPLMPHSGRFLIIRLLDVWFFVPQKLNSVENIFWFWYTHEHFGSFFFMVLISYCNWFCCFF